MASIELLRSPDACQACYERMVRDNPGETDIKKKFPSHLKAICWAYHCDNCARILLENLGVADVR